MCAFFGTESLESLPLAGQRQTIRRSPTNEWVKRLEENPFRPAEMARLPKNENQFFNSARARKMIRSGAECRDTFGRFTTASGVVQKKIPAIFVPLFLNQQTAHSVVSVLSLVRTKFFLFITIRLVVSPHLAARQIFEYQGSQQLWSV